MVSMGEHSGMDGNTRGEDWAGESSRCEDPAPTVGIAGRALREDWCGACRTHPCGRIPLGMR